MKIIIACNPFKGSMTSLEAAAAIEEGFLSVWKTAEVVKVPIADGGDGTLDAVAFSVDCERVNMFVIDALGRRCKSEYLIIDNGKTAVVEMAKASGLAMLGRHERDVMKATTYGTGMLIRDALERGVRKVIIGIGGSATNDGGTGMATALGYRFIGDGGREIEPCGGNLQSIKSIDSSNIYSGIKSAELLVASDVVNPLLGPSGAAAVYAPQKGASDAQVKQLEKGLANLASVVERDLGKKSSSFPGAGAAGGTGYGLVVFLGARLEPGIDLMLDATKMAEKMKGADLAVTGEGRMDSQSAQGKAPFGVLRLAKKRGIPIIAFCGGLEDESGLKRAGFTAVIPVVDRPMRVENAVADSVGLTARAAARTAALIEAGMKLS